jgi:hypothetical protein
LLLNKLKIISSATLYQAHCKLCTMLFQEEHLFLNQKWMSVFYASHHWFIPRFLYHSNWWRRLCGTYLVSVRSTAFEGQSEYLSDFYI